MSRKTKCLPVRNRFLILTNGKRTEKNYFESLRKYKPIYEVTVRFSNDGPEDLINHAVRLKTDFDIIWCVFDKDQFTKDSINKAFQIAKKNDIGIAFSNIAFEVWMLDHFEEHTASATLEKLIEKISCKLKENGCTKTSYNKNDKKTLEQVFLPRLDTAVHNADVRYQKCVVNNRNKNVSLCELNPITTVHKLIETLKLEAKELDGSDDE